MLRSTIQRFFTTSKLRCPRKVPQLLLGEFLPLWKPVSPYIEVRTFDDLYREVEGRLHPGCPWSLIATVRIQVQLECGLLFMQLRQELLAALPITQVGGQDLDPEQQSQGVDDQVAFAPFDLLASVVSFDPLFPRS